MARVEIKLVIDIADDANGGPDYGNQPVDAAFLAEYAEGAREYLFGSVQGVTVVKADVL